MTRKMRQLHAAPLIVVVLLLTRVGVAADEIRVMTSGAFTAAYLELAPEFERATGHRIVTEATSMGTGPTGIAARLERGEAIDVVIVADTGSRTVDHRGADPSRHSRRPGAVGDRHGRSSRRPEAGHQFGRCAEANAAGGEVDRVLGQRERHLPVDGVVPAAWHCRSRPAEESQNRGRRARRGCRRPWRGRDRVSADQRAGSGGRYRLRRSASRRRCSG